MRTTAELVAFLRSAGSTVTMREAADRLAELDAENAKLRDDIGPGITGAELRARYDRLAELEAANVALTEALRRAAQG